MEAYMKSSWFSYGLIGALSSLLVACAVLGAPAVAASAAPAIQLPPTIAVPLRPTDAQSGVCDATRNVRVSGTATIRVAPDRALIKLGVQSNGTTPSSTLLQNQEAVQKVKAALTRLGIAGQDIATDVYIVDPVYDDYSSLRIKGYRIDNVVAITLRDVSLASQAIVVAFDAGANEVVDVQFYTSQLRAYRDQARALAMQAAREKAQALAEAGGTRTGCLLTVAENSWSYIPTYWSRYRGQNVSAQNVIQNAAPNGSAPSGEDTPLSLGMISVEAQIDASFALE
jgi:uncharacterized protein